MKKDEIKKDEKDEIKNQISNEKLNSTTQK